MADQCTSNCNTSGGRRARCPANGKYYQRVSHKCVLHHVRKPWRRELASQEFYYCDDPACDIVYFTSQQQCISRSEIRCGNAMKDTSVNRLVCHCFDIDMQDIADAPVSCRQFVIDNTRTANCACEVRNPSGQCCLKDFPR